MRNFCTYFDTNFWAQGLALYNSMWAHCKPFHLWILAMDDDVDSRLRRLNLECTTVVPMSEFEAAKPRLQPAREERRRIEYIWTLKPSWMMFVLDADQNIPSLTLLDADNFFFNDPWEAYKESAFAPLLITPHRFSPSLMGYGKKVGNYNGGFVHMVRGILGIGCIKEWEDSCIEWCYWKRGEGVRYVDQGYLDLWPAQWNAHPLEHKGAGLAPWNQLNYQYSFSDNRLLVDDQKLLWYHFHKGLKSGYKINQAVEDYIYQIYEQMLGACK